ncbi:MAG: hypothetical protein M3O15_06510 [Acidobacteriota bacterium]|nr:hypothetical protein [Acidobacteriota bacterium]
MHKLLTFSVLALLLLPTVACQKIEARVELKKGNVLYQDESFIKALAQFQKGLKLDPDATFAWRSVGLTALALYRPGDDSPKNTGYANTAIDAFEKYLADYPNDAKVQDYLMSTYVNAKKYDEVLAYLDKMEREHPNEPDKYKKSRINVLTQAGRLDQAQQLALQTPGPDQAEELYSIGVALWSKVYKNNTIDAATKGKMVETGLQALKKALDVKPDYIDAMVYYNLLFHQKADLELDDAKKREDIAQADLWRNRAMDLRKKAQPQKPATTNPGTASGK